MAESKNAIGTRTKNPRESEMICVGRGLDVYKRQALTHWRVLSPMFALQILQANLILMLFNLLPALPLDGGRTLYALLSPVIGRERAVETGILMGRILAGLMLALDRKSTRLNSSHRL